MYRFFIKPDKITRKVVNFTELQSKQMRKVLRMEVGDKVLGFDGEGSEYTIEILKLTNSDSIGKILEEEFVQNTSNIVLYQALPKNLKIEFILQKCTELGIDKIIFFESDFSQVDAKGISENKVERWRRIAIEASEQSRRMFIPTIELSTVSLEDLVKSTDESDTPKFFMDKDGEWLSKHKKELSNDNIIFFIGPEGGFSPREKESFEQFKYSKIKISENTLRSETAGVVVLAQIEALRN